MNESMSNDVIRAEGLGKTYAEGSLHTQVFDGLDIAVAKGETVAILGASGAGKSTLLHLLGGLDVPSAGEVITIACVALAMAFVATLYPAWRAARTAPAEALRYE